MSAARPRNTLAAVLGRRYGAPNRRRRRIATKARTLGAMGLGLALFVAFASPAHAAVLTVTTADDDNTGDPSPGELRYEIREAAPGDTIRIAPGINPQLKPPGAAVPDVTGQILIDKNLIIEGQGANQTTISVPLNGSRIFMIPSTFPSHVVTVRDLTMTGGRAPSGEAGMAPGSIGGVGQSGGAIVNSGQLTLNRVRFAANAAGNGGSGAVGAATTNPGGTGGTGGGGGFGGAILNTSGGDLTIMNSTFDDNIAGDGGSGGKGGNSDGSGMLDVAGNGGPGGVGQDGGAISNAAP